MFKGAIYITGDIDVIRNADLNTTKIINLDEDGILQGIDSIGGTCLLPPIECKIAEADGNEEVYDMVYANHLYEPFQQAFIAALMAYLYNGGQLILFLPEYDSNLTTNKLVAFIYKLYGIHIGIIGNPNPSLANYFYDVSCIPLWLNMLYINDVIGVIEFLTMYPLDANLNGNMSVMGKMIGDLKPYGNNMNQQIKYILNYHKLLHKNPKVRPALYRL